MANYLSLLRQDQSDYSSVTWITPISYDLWHFPVRPVRIGTISSSVLVSLTVPMILLGGFFPPDTDNYVTCIHWSVLCWIITTADVGILSLRSVNSQITCPANCSCHDLSGLTQDSILAAWVPLPYSVAWNLS